MKFVPENIIEETAEMLNEEEGGYERVLEAFRTEQPRLLSYLLSDDLDVFYQGEREFMLYLVLVLWKSIQRVGGPRPQVSNERLSQVEEANWERLQDVSSRRFHERLDVFFEGYQQEDLLAFVEDALSDEDEELVTKEGREAAFVTLKSIIDCLCAEEG